MLFPAGIPRRLAFFDLETTGLSGGAGTTAFLAGVGKLEDGILSVRQVFLADFPGEPGFLKALTGMLPPEDGLVTYNGKSYDTHLLVTRCLMNGIPCTVPRSHADLLYPSRTLFRSITGGCSLKTVENRILGVERTDDVPGALIPEVYFRYLATGDPGPLEGVFRHNVQDIVSLARLLEYILSLFSDPFSGRVADPAGLGRMLITSDNPAAEEYLASALGDGNVPAGRLLGFFLKRSGRLKEACGVWAGLSERFGDITAAVEQAKYLEHREKKPAEALRMLEETIQRRPDLRVDSIPGLRHRMQRLERKASIPGNPGPGT